MYNINHKKVKPSVPSHVQIIPIKELKEVFADLFGTIDK